MVQLIEDETFAEALIKAEEASWEVPYELCGIVVQSIEELIQLFPENDRFGPVRKARRDKNEKFVRYERPIRADTNLSKYVAYGCDECNEIIMGPPKIITETNVFTFLDGRYNPGYYCGECNTHIYELTTL